MQRLAFIKDNQTSINKAVQNLYKSDYKREPNTDVDQALYDGFMDNADKRIGDQIQNLSIEDLKDFQPKFKNQKLSTLLMHFKARNYPETLTEDEAEDWFETVQGRIQAGENGHTSLDNYYQRIALMRKQYPKKEVLWKQLESYAESFL
ncbi:MAG TPA: exodeoxyribonuclease I, partial [Candidatus Thioglobus sp.]|nr:exodeoxyribonuclease I [Candidatus Thioglobus sp.]